MEARRCEIGRASTHLLGADSEVEDGESPAEDLHAMQQVHHTDVLLVGVRVWIPLSVPVVACEAPPLAIGVAQVDACRHDWPVHLGQVRDVRAVLWHLLASLANTIRLLHTS